MPDSSLETLAKAACDVDFSDFPNETVHRTKLHILDTLGVALAGSASVETAQVLDGLGLRQGGGAAPTWALPIKLDARTAAFVNGVSAHAYELDDCGGCDHSGAVVVPAVISVLSDLPKPVSGRDFLRSVLIGYEVGRRVLEAAGGYEVHNGLGWHSTGTCGVFGATAAVGTLLGFDPDKMAAALGIACSFAGGTWSFIHDGSQTKKLHPGRAAEGGVTAAYLARASFKGPSSIFDPGSWGSFFSTFGGDKGDPALLNAGFGEKWRLDRCSIKPYATCRGTHSAIDAVELLLGQHDIPLHQIEAVEVEMSGFQFGMCGGAIVTTRAEAQMSLPYAIAARLQYGKVFLGELEAEAWSAPTIKAWLQRISVRIAPDMADEDEPAITIVGRDGTRNSTIVKFPRGGPLNPLSDAQIIAKYADLAGGVLPKERLEGLCDFILSIETRGDISDLPRLLQ